MKQSYKYMKNHSVSERFNKSSIAHPLFSSRNLLKNVGTQRGSSRAQYPLRFSLSESGVTEENSGWAIWTFSENDKRKFILQDVIRQHYIYTISCIIKSYCDSPFIYAQGHIGKSRESCPHPRDEQGKSLFPYSIAQSYVEKDIGDCREGHISPQLCCMVSWTFHHLARRVDEWKIGVADKIVGTIQIHERGKKQRDSSI